MLTMREFVANIIQDKGENLVKIAAVVENKRHKTRDNLVINHFDRLNKTISFNKNSPNKTQRSAKTLPFYSNFLVIFSLFFRNIIPII